jgi:hypothetical protein
VQALVTVFVLGCSSFIAFKLWFDTAIQKLLKDEQMRILVAEAIQGIVWHATNKPINPVEQWQKMSTRDRFVYGGIISVSLYHLFRS